MYGGDLRRVLRRSVANRVSAFFAGLGVTGLIQSSTATALIVASFAGQGLIGTAPALAVMLGADVGTALVTVLLSFDLSWLAPLLIFSGIVLYLSSQASAARPLRTHPDRSRPDHVRAAMDIGGRASRRAGRRRQGDLRLAHRRRAARHARRGAVHGPVLLEPRGRAARRDARVAARDRAAGRARAGARRQSRQRPARHAVDAALDTRSAARDARQLHLQADRLRARRAARGAPGKLDRRHGARSGARSRAVPPAVQHRARAPARVLDRADRAHRRADAAGATRVRGSGEAAPPRPVCARHARRWRSRARRAKRCASAT